MRRTIRALVLLASLVFATKVDAQDADYERALERALSAHAGGDYETARTSMEEAHAISPSARTLRGLGIIAHAQGRLIDAVAPLEASLVSVVHPLTPALRSAVEELLTRVLSQLARVRLVLEPRDAALTVDEHAPRFHTPAEILLTPGTHHLAVVAPEHAERRLDVVAHAGEPQTVHVVLAPLRHEPIVAEMLKPAPAVGNSASNAHRDVSWWTPRVRNIGLSASGVLVLAGSALLLTAWRKFEHLEELCDESGGCSRQEAEQRLDEERVRPYARAGIALCVVGGALLGSVLTIELVQKRGSEKTEVALGPGTLQVRAPF